MVQLQNSISEHLHHHTFSNMLSNETFEAHHAQILSCFILRVGVWLITWPVFPTFWLSSPIFRTTFCIQLGLPHSLVVGIPWCVCTHPINFMGIHLLRCVHGNERTETHDAIHDTFATITQNASFHMGQKQLPTLPSTTFNSSCRQVNIVHPKDGIFTLVECHCQPSVSKFTSLILCNSRICCLRCSLSQGKELSQLTPHWSNPPLNNWNIWLILQTC